jgi:hypothetical protein
MGLSYVLPVQVLSGLDSGLGLGGKCLFFFFFCKTILVSEKGLWTQHVLAHVKACGGCWWMPVICTQPSVDLLIIPL